MEYYEALTAFEHQHRPYLGAFAMHDQLWRLLRQRFQPAEGVVPHDGWDFTHQFGNAADALIYVPLFFPEFIEIQGSVLLARNLPSLEQSFSEAKRRNNMSIPDLESSFNSLELAYAFSNTAPDSYGESDLLAHFVAQAWRDRLKVSYPYRRFQVLILPSEQTGSVTAVSFFEIR